MLTFCFVTIFFAENQNHLSHPKHDHQMQNVSKQRSETNHVHQSKEKEREKYLRK